MAATSGRSSSQPRAVDDVPTLVAIGTAVALCASLAHEALGHGLGCMADHGSVTLLTFLVFRCEGAGLLADGGGPIGAFVVAALCLAALRLFRPKPSVGSLFAYALGIQTMFWVCAQAVREGIDGSDDWGHVGRDLAWPPGWHMVVIAAASIGYVLTIRIAAALGKPLAQRQPARLYIPYAAATVIAVFFGALWHGARAASALDAFLSFGVAPLGYLFAIGVIARAPVPSATHAISRSVPWLAAVTIACLAFAFTIAQGVGRLA